MKQTYLEQIWTYVCSRCRGEISFLIYVDKKEIKIPVHLYPNLCDLMDCSPWGTSVHGILQTRTLKWVAIPFSRGSSQLRDWTQVSCIAGRFFTIWATRKGSVLVSNVMVGEDMLEWNRTFLIDSELIQLWEDILLWATVRAYTGASLNLCVWGNSLNPLQRID